MAYVMNLSIAKLHQIASREERLIIGLMSGTSLDGLDVALCRFRGDGHQTSVQLVAFRTVSYTEDIKGRIQSVFAKKQADLQQVCLLNAWIGTLHAEMVLSSLQEWNYQPGQVDLIASHGQTIYHAPKSLHSLPDYPNATLQIGDGDHIAVRTGIIYPKRLPAEAHCSRWGRGSPGGIRRLPAFFASGRRPHSFEHGRHCQFHVPAR
jgi:anhydro-N-acetylmuramic acid kinase